MPSRTTPPPTGTRTGTRVRVHGHSALPLYFFLSYIFNVVGNSISTPLSVLFGALPFARARGGGRGAPRVGGVQSFSYWPWPRSDEAAHERGQAAWLKQQNLTVASVLAKAFFDTYLFHYDDDGKNSSTGPCCEGSTRTAPGL